MSDITLVSPSAVQSNWTQHAGSVSISGIGSRHSDKEVEIPIVWQHKMATQYIRAYVMDLPDGIDLLVGVSIQDSLDMRVERANKRVLFYRDHVSAPMLTVQEVTTNLAREPMSVLAACSGASFAYSSLRNLGHRVEKWTAIEVDDTCKQVARRIVPKYALREVHNMSHIPASLHREHYDLYLDTCPCQPWSRLNNDCIGFKDTRSRPMHFSMELYNNLKKVNPRIKLLAENVKTAPSPCGRRGPHRTGVGRARDVRKCQRLGLSVVETQDALHQHRRPTAATASNTCTSTVGAGRNLL